MIKHILKQLCLLLHIGGGAYTPIGISHWCISLKTDTPNMSFGVSVSSDEQVDSQKKSLKLLLPDVIF